MNLRTYNRNVILCIIGISGFMIGTEVPSLCVFLSTEEFQDFYGDLIKREQALLSASTAIGAVLASVIFGSFCDAFGCVLCFQASNTFWIVGTLVIVILEYIYVLILGRVIKGFAIGIITCLVPVYISEIFPFKKKGSSISFFQISAAIGTVVIYFVGYILEVFMEKSLPFKVTWSIEAAPALLLLVCTLWLPESPKWLASKSKWLEAARTLERVRTIKKRAKDDDHREYVTRAYTAGNSMKFCKYSDLFSRSHWKSTSTGLLLHFFVQIGCVLPLMFYFTYLCDSSGLDESFTLIFVSVQYIILGIMTLVPVVLLDKARRVDCLVYGMLAISLAFGTKFVLLVIYSIPMEVRGSPFQWVLEQEPASAVLALSLFITSIYASSITSLCWLYTGELFEDDARAKGTSICMCLGWITNGIMTLLLRLMFKTMGYYVFLILSLCCFMGFVVFCFFPETKYSVELIMDSEDNPGNNDLSEKLEEPNSNRSSSLSVAPTKGNTPDYLNPKLEGEYAIILMPNDLTLKVAQESHVISDDSTINRVIEAYNSETGSDLVSAFTRAEPTNAIKTSNSSLTDVLPLSDSWDTNSNSTTRRRTVNRVLQTTGDYDSSTDNSDVSYFSEGWRFEGHQ